MEPEGDRQGHKKTKDPSSGQHLPQKGFALWLLSPTQCGSIIWSLMLSWQCSFSRLDEVRTLCTELPPEHPQLARGRVRRFQHLCGVLRGRPLAQTGEHVGKSFILKDRVVVRPRHWVPKSRDLLAWSADIPMMTTVPTESTRSAQLQLSCLPKAMVILAILPWQTSSPTRALSGPRPVTQNIARP